MSSFLKEEKKGTIILFANTLWFFENFKYDLIIFLSKYFLIKCIYLRSGDNLDKEKIESLRKNKNVSLMSLNYFLLRQNSFLNIFLNKNNHEIKAIIIHTIECILLSILLPLKYRRLIIYVFEGLGRVFSSRLILYRLIKRIVIPIYEFSFKACKFVILLNSSDAAFFAELGIIPIRKMRILPGTGIDIDLIDRSINYERSKAKFIDFIGRMIPEKGYIPFIYIRLNLLEYFPDLAKKYKFRIITPQSYIKALSNEDKKYLKNIGIEIKTYSSNSFDYYKDSKIIILPSTYGEGISRVVLEAAYIGIPLLVSRNKGIEDLFPFNYKYFINSKNPAKITMQLVEMLNEKEYFNTTNLILRGFIKDYFSSKKSIDKFSNYLFDFL